MTAVLRRPSSAVKATRVVEVASHLDDVGALVSSLACGPSFDYSRSGAPRVENCVLVNTDGPGFLALVDRFQLRVVVDGLGNINGFAEVGLLDVPVHVFCGLTRVLAAGLTGSVS